MLKELSAVLIAKNEAKVVGRCIRSLGAVDEIVIYDTGSSDGTQEIAAKAGARVVQGDPIDPFHFAEARNRANEHAQGTWILTIDADEILRAGSLSKIRKALDKVADETAYAVTFINRTSKGTLSFPTPKIKLFMKDAWTWQYRVHERLKSLREGRVGALADVVMEHMPDPDKKARHGQNVQLLEMCVRENPEYTRAFRHLGLELLLQKRPAEAIPYFAHYVDNTDENRFQKSQAMCHVGKCLESLGKLDEALEWFERAAKVAPERRDPMYHAALGLIKACRLDEALTWIRRMIEVPVETRPNLPYDLPILWGQEPVRMLRFCQVQIAAAKAAYEARKK